MSPYERFIMTVATLRSLSEHKRSLMLSTLHAERSLTPAALRLARELGLDRFLTQSTTESFSTLPASALFDLSDKAQFCLHIMSYAKGSYMQIIVEDHKQSSTLCLPLSFAQAKHLATHILHNSVLGIVYHNHIVGSVRFYETGQARLVSLEGVEIL